MNEHSDVGNAPWSLRVPIFTKPRAFSDTSVFRCIPTSKSSPDFTRKTSADNLHLPLLQIQESSSTHLHEDVGPTTMKERAQTMRPTSSPGSERTLDFIIKLTKSEKNVGERSYLKSPRILRKARRKSRAEETVTTLKAI